MTSVVTRRSRQRTPQKQQRQQQRSCITTGGGGRTAIRPLLASTITMAFLPQIAHSRSEASVTAMPSSLFSNTNGIVDQFNTLSDHLVPRNVPFTNPADRQTGEQEVVSNGTVYATCPDLSYITGPMYDADSNPQNGFLTQDEYYEFTNEISGGFLENEGWDDFGDMPLSLQETYLVLSCLCELFEDEDWGGPGCCDTSITDITGIRTDGTEPGGTPDPIQMNYLTYVCGTMSESLGSVGGVVVAQPTEEPSEKPTLEPSKKPTELPTAEPTKKPTSEPTKQPTKIPTPNPTTQPTSEPSPSPTKRPTPLPVEPGEPTKRPSTPQPFDITPFPTIEVEPTPAPVEPGTPTKSPTPQPLEPGTPTQKPTTPQPIETGSPTRKPTFRPIGFTTDIPAAVDFQANLGSQVTAEEVLAGETNQVKVKLEEQLLVLSEEVIEEEFDSGTVYATLATLDDVQDVECPDGSLCLKFNNTILLTLSEELDASETVTAFEAAMLAKIADDNWLDDNFDLEDALKPPGDVPATVNFVASFDGKVTAEEVMAGKTNQVKVTLEKSLLELSEVVIGEEFGSGTVYATSATLYDAQDVQCPDGSPCLNFNNVILLYLSDELDASETVTAFEAAMKAQIENGWLKDNFDLNEALKPPPSPRDVPASVDFEANLGGEVTAEEVMAGKTNQVKVLLEEALLELSGIVIGEEFESDTVYATSASLDDVKDIECEGGSPCLKFNNTILIYLADGGLDVGETVATFEAAMLAKIGAGWLGNNFDLAEALNPPSTKNPTTAPTPSPTVSRAPVVEISSNPSSSPSISSAPTANPTSTPSLNPSISFEPSTSSAPSSAPSTSSQPTSSAAPSNRYTGTAPARVDFIATLNGQVTAEEVMAGETNQVKVMLEESLLELSNIVIEEEFGTARNLPTSAAETTGDGSKGFGRSGSTSSTASGGELKLRRRVRERVLIVKNATKATLDSAQDVECPPGPPSGAEGSSTVPAACLAFNNTILLYMEKEGFPDEKVAIFEAAMRKKIADGWLAKNFDLEEALKPPPTDDDVDRVTNPDDSQELEPQPLSIGAIIGIIVAVLFCFLITLVFGDRYRRNDKDKDRDAEAWDIERQQSAKDEEVAQDMGLDPSTGDDSSMTTADKSYTSQDHLLQGQRSSTAYSSALGEMKTDEDSEVEESIYSTSSEVEDVNRLTYSEASPLAAMAAASTLVSSTTPPATPANDAMESYSPINFDSDTSTGTNDFPMEDPGGVGSRSLADSPLSALAASPSSAMAASTSSAYAASPSTAGWSGSSGGAEVHAANAMGAPEEEGGIGAGAAAAIGAGAAGLMAAGAYAVTRSHDEKEEETARSSSIATPSDPTLSSGSATIPSGDLRTLASTPSSTPNAMEDLDNAIESGNWGQVGALAAVLVSQGHGSPGSTLKKSGERSAAGPSGSTSYDSSAVSSGSRSSVQGSQIEQARAVEIDKLVESGDWQGVVLAAARFEADSTFDGESFSNTSASQSSRWSQSRGSRGSATSATTPRSMATTDQSASNMSSQRGQEEIRAEVEALVRRVVPEEADNIDEMMMQFKGREEELVETLRRMQERAIASRARLAVQKSAKLEARAKASPRASAASAADAAPSSSSSVQSAGTSGSTKSELEHAIESGNWQAVGAAAQKMSDSSIGELSDEDKQRLRDAISHSPAFSRSRSRGRAASEDYNLDKLIEQGNWAGVIAAAKSASEGPDASISAEEQEAMAQANMWQEIADQSKQDAGQGPAGAGDAAAWAISRSLNAMNTSEESSSAVRTIHDIASESSDDQYESSDNGDSAPIDEYRRGI